MNQLFNISVLGRGLQALKTAASLRVTPPVRRLNRFSFTIRCFYFQPSHLGLLRVETSSPFPVRGDACPQLVFPLTCPLCLSTRNLRTDI